MLFDFLVDSSVLVIIYKIYLNIELLCCCVLFFLQEETYAENLKIDDSKLKKKKNVATVL